MMTAGQGSLTVLLSPASLGPPQVWKVVLVCDCCYVSRHSQTMQAVSKSMLKQGMGVYLGFTWVGNLVIKVAPSVNMAV